MSAAPLENRHVLRLTQTGNSTGVVLPRELLKAANLKRGDEVVVTVTANESITLQKADTPHSRGMEAGHRFMDRYARTLALLAK